MGQAARAAADGYTVLFVSSSFVVNPSLYPKIPYDPYKDFARVTVVGDAPNILLVNPTVPARTVRELIDYIKANPGKVSYGSAGTGTTPHLSGELFRLTLDLDIVHVPFGGAGPAIQSLAGGHTPMAFTSLPPAIPLIHDGKIRALAVSASKRVAPLPDVPTLAEAGLPDQETDTMQAVLVPAGTPRSVVDLIYREIKAWRCRTSGSASRCSASTPSPTRRNNSPRRSRSRSRSGARSFAAPTSRWTEPSRIEPDAQGDGDARRRPLWGVGRFIFPKNNPMQSRNPPADVAECGAICTTLLRGRQ
jgi:hypothetical protein